MGNFDVTTPAGSDLLGQGDDTIRELKVAIREALRAGAVAGDDIEGVEAVFPGASPSTAPVYRYRGLKGTTAARPAAGQYGFYYDTDRKTLQRDIMGRYCTERYSVRYGHGILSVICSNRVDCGCGQ